MQAGREGERVRGRPATRARWERGGSGRRGLRAAALAGLLAAAPVSADPPETPVVLEAGRWTGSYQPIDSDPVDVAYTVATDADAPAGWTLLVQLLLDPRDAWAFEARDLKVNAERVKFVFGREGDPHKCRLEPQGDLELVGSCRSSDDSGAARIVMKRPAPAPPE